MDRAFRTRAAAPPVPVAPALRGRWVVLETDGPVPGAGVSGAGAHLVRCEISHDDGEPEWVALRGRRRPRTAFFVGPTARTIRLHVFGGAPVAAADLRLRPPRPVGSLRAAVLLTARADMRARLLARPLPRGARAWRQRLHDAEAATIADLAVTYATWLAAFAPPAPPPAAAPPDPPIAFLVFAPAPGPALAATLAALGAAPHAVTGPGEDWQVVATRLALPPGGYVGLLGAGEILAPGAIDAAATALRAADLPAIALADHDRLGTGGERRAPAFGPEPNHALMLSGTLADGLWLLRADTVVPGDDTGSDHGGHASLARLRHWLAGRRAGAEGGRRLPVVLTSRRPDAPSPAPEALAAVIGDHLDRAGLPLRVRPGAPVRLEPTAAVPPGTVAALVPSSLRAPHAERCLAAILADTGAPGLDMVVVVSQPEPLDAEQRAVAARLAAAGARIVHLPDAAFNFSRAINRAARETTAARLLLLNDDVTPLEPTWLARMCAHLADRPVGIVGARLLYPNGTIQHAGVIMGQHGLCDHAFRGEPGDAPGYEWRAQLPQRLLVVTGACLLVEARLFHALDGLDERYPSAFNDVDFCLRAGEHGREVVLSDATLIHHELQTYGGHYAGARAPHRAGEVERMRRRWKGAIAADPFYNPNLSLLPGAMWTPAVPPRASRAGQNGESGK